jgi:hypothetical protein
MWLRLADVQSYNYFDESVIVRDAATASNRAAGCEVSLLILRVVATLLGIISVFGFLNAFFFRFHGPGGDLGIVAGILALAAWGSARWLQSSP